jgi:hypothetical protein
MKQVCRFEDDNGNMCGRFMSAHQSKQDGICARCADLCWEKFVKPLWQGEEIKSIILEEK